MLIFALVQNALLDEILRHDVQIALQINIKQQ